MVQEGNYNVLEFNPRLGATNQDSRQKTYLIYFY